MTRTKYLTRAAVLAAVGALAGGHAMATASWDLDQCASKGGNYCKDSGSNVYVTIGAYDANANSDTFNSAIVNATTSGWMGVKSKNSNGTTESTTSPHHAIDNYSSSGASWAELVHLQFSKAVDLSQVVASWANDTGGDADFLVFRWNYNATTTDPSITSFAPNQMPGTVGSALNGWQLVASADFKPTTAQAISDGTYYSSHWLISTAFGGGNDAFKLGSVIATGACVGGNTTGGNTSTGGCATTTTPPSGVPEPASMALAGLALAGLASSRRRRAPSAA